MTMADTTSSFLSSEIELTLIAYNMHGYNQGMQTVMDFIHELNPHVICLQEHWLTPANMNKLDEQ